MALTVLDRPQGHVIDPTGGSATITNSSGALVTTISNHGLSTGDYVFIESNVSSYNGYWYVEVISINTFQLREYASADIVDYVIDAVIVYYKSVLNHNWSAVHLPIVYKLSSTLWPINSVDTVRTIVSISSLNGYVGLNLSGDIKATGSAAELEFVQIFGQNAGIYQIMAWISDTAIVIDIPYDSGLSFTASTIQYYYNNFNIRVRVYAGLPDSHIWAAQKPYELISTFNVSPNAEDGVASINISDYIKSKIEIDKNDTTLDTLPNDINSFCSFYIEYAEAYTYSNGYTLGTNVTSFTSDKSTFEGFAINACLPFKTQSSGFMSEYVSGLTDATRQKFLTGFSEPEMFSGQFFDISFILNSNSSGFYILEQYVTGGVISNTSVTAITDYDIGVYRFAVTYLSGYDSVRVTLFDSANLQLSETKEIKLNADCGNFYTDLCWKNNLGGHDYWRFISGKQKSISTTKEQTATNIFSNWPRSYGKMGETIRKNSKVTGFKPFLIRSQYVTNQQAEDIGYGIHMALLVQEVTSETDKRTVLVDAGSFNVVEETDKLVEVSMKIRYTDDMPTQSL